MKCLLTLLFCFHAILANASPFTQKLNTLTANTPKLVILPKTKSYRNRIKEAAIKIATEQLALSLTQLEYKPNYHYPKSYDYKYQTNDTITSQSYLADKIRYKLDTFETPPSQNHLQSLQETLSYILHEIIHEIHQYFQLLETPHLPETHLSHSPTARDQKFFQQHQKIDSFFCTNYTPHFTQGCYDTHQSQITQGSLPLPTQPTIAGHSIKSLLRSANAPDRAGLTKAGRSLAKHSARRDSFLQQVNGSPQKINKVASKEIERLLNHPNAKWEVQYSNRFGKVINIRIDEIGGIRYNADGEFLHFLEPKL